MAKYVIDDNYKNSLLPRRLLFFDLDGTLIPSTAVSGRRTAISLIAYEQLGQFAQKELRLPALPDLDKEQCSEWYRSRHGPHGLVNRVLEDADLSPAMKDCLSFYFNGLFSRRLTQYLEEDLQHDQVPEEYLGFLRRLSGVAFMILVSYRYQTQPDFLRSLERLGLMQDGLFAPSNAFAVGGPGTSSDGSKARFVGAMWRREIRAQRRLTSDIGKTFPPIVLGDSVRDVQFAVDVGGMFFGVSDTGEGSQEALLDELRRQGKDLSPRSRVFSSLADEDLQRRLLAECHDYMQAIETVE